MLLSNSVMLEASTRELPCAGHLFCCDQALMILDMHLLTPPSTSSHQEFPVRNSFVFSWKKRWPRLPHVNSLWKKNVRELSWLQAPILLPSEEQRSWRKASHTAPGATQPGIIIKKKCLHWRRNCFSNSKGEHRVWWDCYIEAWLGCSSLASSLLPHYYLRLH